MNPPSAPTTPESAPRAMERPLEPAVRLLLTRAQAEKAGLLDRWEAALRRRDRKRSAKMGAQERLNAVAARLLEAATAAKLSRRQALKLAGLSWGTWTRCLSGQADPVRWLPVFEAGLARVAPKVRE